MCTMLLSTLATVSHLLVSSQFPGSAGTNQIPGSISSAACKLAQLTGLCMPEELLLQTRSAA